MQRASVTHAVAARATMMQQQLFVEFARAHRTLDALRVGSPVARSSRLFEHVERQLGCIANVTNRFLHRFGHFAHDHVLIARETERGQARVAVVDLVVATTLLTFKLQSRNRLKLSFNMRSMF